MPDRTATVLRLVGCAIIADTILGFVFLDRHRWHYPCNGKFHMLETQPITFIATRALSLSDDDDDVTEDPFADFDPRISPLKSQPKNPSSVASSGMASMDITASVAKSLDRKNTTITTKKGKIDDEGDIDSLGFLLSVHEKVMSSSTADDDDSVMQPGPENKNKDDDPFADFDPRISPHMYPGGIASGTTDQNKDATTSKLSPKRNNNENKIGVVLIDHGSKRESSNTHLETVAQAYQERCPPHFEVVAAHMEIAPPSIADAVDDLVLNRAVDRIVCHPYFLSPGRHVMQDIPQLIEEATTRVEAKLRASQDDGDKNRKVQIVTTTPTGSQMKLMLDAVAKSVERSVKNELGGSKNGGDDGLGFLGDVMRMMDEQLESK